MEEREGQGRKEGGCHAECLKKSCKLALFKAGSREKTHGVLASPLNFNVQSSVFHSIYLNWSTPSFHDSAIFDIFCSLCFLLSHLTWSEKHGASGGRSSGNDNVTFTIANMMNDLVSFDAPPPQSSSSLSHTENVNQNAKFVLKAHHAPTIGHPTREPAQSCAEQSPLFFLLKVICKSKML